MVVEADLPGDVAVNIEHRGDASGIALPAKVRLVRRPRVEDMPYCQHGFQKLPCEVVSTELLELIRSFDPDGVEGYRAWLFRDDLEPIDGAKDYHVLNVTRFIECYDHDRVTIKREDDGYQIIIPYIIDPRRVPPGVHIFRTAPGIPWLVVSTELRDAIIDANMVGPQLGKAVNRLGDREQPW